MSLLNWFDPLFPDSITHWLPKRRSSRFNCTFPAIYNTATELSSALEKNFSRVGHSKAIIRHRSKKNDI